jgi:hypothetical protein
MFPRDLYECSCGARNELIWSDDREKLLSITHQGLHAKPDGQCVGPMTRL